MCSNPHQHHSYNCKIIVLPGDEHRNSVMSAINIHGQTNDKLLTREQLTDKLKITAKKAKQAQRKVKLIQEKYEKDMIELKADQAKAIREIYLQIDKTTAFDNDDNFKILWESQRHVMELHNRSSMWWHPK